VSTPSREEVLPNAPSASPIAATLSGLGLRSPPAAAQHGQNPLGRASAASGRAMASPPSARKNKAATGAPAPSDLPPPLQSPVSPEDVGFDFHFHVETNFVQPGATAPAEPLATSPVEFSWVDNDTSSLAGEAVGTEWPDSMPAKSVRPSPRVVPSRGHRQQGSNHKQQQNEEDEGEEREENELEEQHAGQKASSQQPASPKLDAGRLHVETIRTPSKSSKRRSRAKRAQNQPGESPRFRALSEPSVGNPAKPAIAEPKSASQAQTSGSAGAHGALKVEAPSPRSPPDSAPSPQTRLAELLNAARRLVDQEQFRKAEKRLNELLELEPGCVDALFVRSTVRHKLSKLSLAIIDCSTVVHHVPRHAKACLRIVRLSRTSGYFATAGEAIAHINHWFSDRGDEASLSVIEQAKAEFELLERVRELYRALKRALASGPGSSSCDVKLKGLQQLCPDWPSYHVLRAVCFLAKDDSASIAAAERHLKRAVLLRHTLKLANNRTDENCDRETGELVAAAARALHRAGKYHAASRILSEVAKAFTGSPLPLAAMCHQTSSSLGNLFGKLQAAKDRANDLFKRKLYDEAIYRYGEALKIDPSHTAMNAVFHCNRAAARMAKRQFLEALQDCDDALRLCPDYIKAHVRRARIFAARSEFQSALNGLDAAIDSFPCSELEQEREAILKEGQRAKRAAKNEERQRAHNSRYERNRSWRTGGGGSAWGREACGRQKSEGNFYTLLGVSPTATAAEIRKAYYALARKYHPDKAGKDDSEAAEKFKQIAGAYETLSDESKRRTYDLSQVSSGSGHWTSSGASRTQPSYYYYYY